MMLTSIAGITGGSGSHSRSSGATTAVFLIKISDNTAVIADTDCACVRACVCVLEPLLITIQNIWKCTYILVNGNTQV